MKNELKKMKPFHKLISIYRIIGLIPHHKKNIDIFFVGKCQMTITVLTGFSAIGLGIHLKEITRAGPKYRNDQIDDINAILQCCIAQSYITILLLVGNKMLKFFDRLETNKPTNIVDVIKRFEKFSASYYKTTFFMCFVYALDNTLRDSYCNLKEMVKDNTTLICGSMIPMWFPMRLSSIVQFCLKMVNLFVLMVYFPAALAIPAFGLGSMEMIIARIRHLKWMLTHVKFGESANVELTKTQLRNCIKYFNEIKRYRFNWNPENKAESKKFVPLINFRALVRDMDSSISLLFIPQYTLMSTILALLEYQMIVQFSAATVIRFLGWVFMEFVICMKGQDLSDESLELARCVYDMKWYEMHPKTRSMYTIFHMAVQQTIKFQAKPFVPLDRKFFMNVLKSSYSLMMFFRTWSNEV